MYHAGDATKVSGLPYRQLDNIVRNRRLRPSRAAAQGRGTVRSFSERDLVALRVTRDILGAGHRLGPFMHIVRYVQHGRELPPLDQLEGTMLVSNGREVRVLDGATSSLSETLDPRSVLYVIDLGAAARHVRRGIERLARRDR